MKMSDHSSSSAENAPVSASTFTSSPSCREDATTIVDGDAHGRKLVGEEAMSQARCGQPHAEYYFDDYSLEIQAEGIVFRVHDYIFSRESTKGHGFVRMHKAGDTDITGIEARDLESLFRVMYCRITDPIALQTEQEWTSVLDLGHKWEFASYKALAVEKLGLLASPVERIYLGRKYDIPSWIKPAYLQLCQRVNWLTDEEGHRVGSSELLKICRAWTAFRATPWSLRSPSQKDAILVDVLGPEVQTLRNTKSSIPPASSSLDEQPSMGDLAATLILVALISWAIYEYPGPILGTFAFSLLVVWLISAVYSIFACMQFPAN